MDGVAAKVAVEVVVRFEQCHFDTLTCQEQREKHAAGSTPDDATGGRGFV
jgi:hypothetical protein